MSLSLPGLGLAEPEEAPTVAPTTSHTLARGSEWRFEVAHGKRVKLRLLAGAAELFGTELVASGTPYTFSGTKAALYTWHGCSFEVSGDVLQSEYTAEETPMSEWVNVHLALEGWRDVAAAGAAVRAGGGGVGGGGGGGGGGEGPRVLVLGPDDAGKSTLCKTLTAYAVRGGRSVAVVNLDTRGEGVMSLPGTMTATVFRSLLDVEEGWGVAPMSGPSGAVPVKLPLVYYYGLEGVAEKEGAVYRSLMGRLALAVSGRMQGDVEAREGGLLIDTPGVLTSAKIGPVGYDIIQHIVSEFAVNAVICLGSERLYSDMVKRFDGKPTSSASAAATGETISVIKLAKSGGCVDRDEAFMQGLRAAQIKAYFYGAPRGTGGVTLSPRQQQVDFYSLSIYRCTGSRSSGQEGGGGGGDDDSFLPGGVEEPDFYSSASESKVALPQSQLYEHLAAPHPGMRNSVLAIMNCEPDAKQEEICDSSVMGFLYVTDVDEAKGRLGVLSPVAGRIPNRAIVWGNWPEGVLGMV